MTGCIILIVRVSNNIYFKLNETQNEMKIIISAAKNKTLYVKLCIVF
jgi:hypothetical protein